MEFEGSIHLIYERNLILFNNYLFMANFARINRIIKLINRLICLNSNCFAH